jgi:hypothetical protein
VREGEAEAEVGEDVGSGAELEARAQGGDAGDPEGPGVPGADVAEADPAAGGEETGLVGPIKPAGDPGGPLAAAGRSRPSTKITTPS